ncbi:SPOR domain-containing protein [Thiorhodococcus mannitoliphagus]|uniref:SPOR domain-containing protein n=1 Tax=Thiorhodococcus mannitoliphagus TaxID=329406 RepID=A0A6P1DR52_9GAMM|nr:SPOR domain-containing protein [Thiorhodococcus mannitoliphagus]NEX19411.1 SPOR domain-containing protein [Thiorhodococcus mannitoliphagus]
MSPQHSALAQQHEKPIEQMPAHLAEAVNSKPRTLEPSNEGADRDRLKTIPGESKPVTTVSETAPATEGPLWVLPAAVAPPDRSGRDTASADAPARDTAGSHYRWQVQVLAGRSLAKVKEDRRLFIERYSDILDGRNLSISQSDYGDARDGFYRLRVLDWADPAKATEWCERLSVQGQACLVIRVGNDGVQEEKAPFLKTP